MNIAIRKTTNEEKAVVIVRELREGVGMVTRREVSFAASGGLETEDLKPIIAEMESEVENFYAARAKI